MSATILLITAAIAILAIASVNLLRHRKIQQINSSYVAHVTGAGDRYPGLPLESYGVPLTANASGRVEVVFPRLTAEGDVEHIHSWHRLEDVHIPPVAAAEWNETLKTAYEIATVIKEHLSIEPEISALEEQYNKLNKLARLVSTSELYSSQLPTYERAMAQVERILEKAADLENLYIRITREALIGLEIADYQPDAIQDKYLYYAEKHKQLKEEYRHVKQTLDVYTHLLQERSQTVMD